MPPLLSIVVLSWNVEELLAACLASLPGAAGDLWPDSEVIVVDNASTDGSAEMVRTRFPHTRLILMDSNRGFTGGNNAGISASRGKYVLLLNPDTIAHEGSIATLADYMEAHPETGIAGPRLLNPDGTLQTSRRRFPTLATALIESTPLQQRFPNAAPLRRFYMLDRPDDETQQVDWLSGAALMCRRVTLDQAGRLDPGYFMFSEEVDLCRRVNDAGWRVMYVPQAEITHYGGQSTGQDVPARHISFNTSKARYFRIHEGPLMGSMVRRYLLAVYALQLLGEAAKWLLGHKRSLRAERIGLYAQVLKSGFREPGRRGKKADVLLITGEYPPARGGVGDYTCRLQHALNEEGVQPRVLTHEGSGIGGRGLGEITDYELRITKETTQNSNLKIQNWSRPPLRAPRITLHSTLRALRGTGAGVAHIQYQTGAFAMRPTVNLLPLLLRRRWRGATVVTFHDLRVPYLFPKAGPVREWVNRVLARSADAAIATNTEDYERLRRWGVRNLRLIPIGSNIADDPPPGYDRVAWRATHGAGPDTNLLAYFGFLSSTKGLDDLLRALAALKSRGDFRLVMVGGGLGSSDPTNRATALELDALAASLGVREELIWTGYLEPQEVSAALRAADMAVLPYSDGASFRRGSLLAVLEHGLPVVTTTPAAAHATGAGAPLPRLESRRNCLLVPVGDARALTEGIAMLARDDVLRGSLRAGARDLAEAFGWRAIARMHRELYRELQARREVGHR